MRGGKNFGTPWALTVCPLCWDDVRMKDGVCTSCGYILLKPSARVVTPWWSRLLTFFRHVR